MKLSKALCLLVPAALLTAGDVSDAHACGGCFVPPDANTQVTGHRMVLSVSPAETTLWDQITYTGDPASFAWVLPTKGVVTIGLSSDLLFNTLDFMTGVQIVPPSLNCPYSCPPDDGEFNGGGGAGGGSAGGGVEVIAQEVVGPYETVQLSASDPQALQTWLADHGYAIPADVAPVVDAYVAEGFNFLALKLVPGQGIDSMKPVRVTTPGASPGLPLRMVAAGTGATTPITLWVLGEGRYGPANFGEFTIPHHEVIWNWDTSESNYATLKQAGFDAAGGLSWLIESAWPESKYGIEDIVMPVVSMSPDQSGYGQPDGTGAEEEALADLAALYGSIDPVSLFLTRMHAELPRPALANDLQIAAAADQTTVSHVFEVTNTTGTAPTCPPDPCAGGSSSGNGSSGAGAGSTSGAGDPSSPGDPSLWAAGGGCAMGGPGAGAAATLAGLGLFFAAASRRRRVRR